MPRIRLVSADRKNSIEFMEMPRETVEEILSNKSDVIKIYSALMAGGKVTSMTLGERLIHVRHIKDFLMKNPTYVIEFR